MAEFDLIRSLHQAMRGQSGSQPLVPVIGIGDDAAVLQIPPDRQLVVTTDTLIEGTHFLPGIAADDLAHKALAVNLSDLAAMGAEPGWFFLALTLPDHDPQWMSAFADGLAGLAGQSGIILAGGDTTSGPLSITITAIGLVEPGQALTRSGACDGDLVVVSGTLGDAALALKSILSGGAPDPGALSALLRPQPRLALGKLLKGLATACIDISDGLLADLRHILHASGMGAEIQLFQLPCSASLGQLEAGQRFDLQLTGGDDYELCFTVPAEQEKALRKVAQQTGLALTVVGRVNSSGELTCLNEQGAIYVPDGKPYEHFSSEPAGSS